MMAFERPRRAVDLRTPTVGNNGLNGAQVSKEQVKERSHCLYPGVTVPVFIASQFQSAEE